MNISCSSRKTRSVSQLSNKK